MAAVNTPFVRRIRIRGYKSIAFCDVMLEPLTLFVGRNAAGKSNFLDAIGFLRDFMTTNLTQAAERHGGWSAIRHRYSPGNTIHFELDIEFSGSQISSGEQSVPSIDPDRSYIARYALTLAMRNESEATIERERVIVTDSDSECCFGFRFEDSTLSEGHSVRSDTESKCVFTPLQRLNPGSHSPAVSLCSVLDRYSFMIRAIGSMMDYRFSTDRIRRSVKSSTGSFLERDGINLASVIRDTQTASPRTINRVAQFLGVLVPQIDRFEAVKCGEHETIRFWFHPSRSGQAEYFEASSVSDGTLRTLAALMAGYQTIPSVGAPTLVAIDEPETSLHPSSISAMIDAFDETTLRTQVILVTNSVEMLNNRDLHPKNVRVLQMVNGETRVGKVDPASVEIYSARLNTLGGMERDNQLEIDEDDFERQQRLREGTSEVSA